MVRSWREPIVRRRSCAIAWSPKHAPLAWAADHGTRTSRRPRGALGKLKEMIGAARGDGESVGRTLRP